MNIISSQKIIFIVLLISFLSSQNSGERKSETTSAVDKQLLAGNWSRTDAAYLITIRKINADGTLNAQYFNPKSINVSSANWVQSHGNLKIMIELRDVNYPGLNYTLNYLPDRDMLAGEYYQAVEGLTFYVEFQRQ